MVHTSSGDRLPIVTRLFTCCQQKAWLTPRSTSGYSRLVFRYGRRHIRKREQQQQQQQQQQHFISPHNLQEIKIYNNSTDDDRGAGCPK